MILTILIFVVLLGILVLIHEWGHFATARRFGVRVEEFAFGFPPRIASITRGGVRYAFNLFPIGGYVKIHGEGGEDASDPQSFSSRPAWQRFVIIAAGVGMNLVLAWFLFAMGHAIGLPTVVDAPEDAARSAITIIGLAPGSPAEAAGIHFGDTVSAVGKPGETPIRVSSIEAIQEFITAHRGEEVLIDVTRGTEMIQVLLTPRADPPPGEGALGIAMAYVGTVRSPWYQAPWDGLRTLYNSIVAIVLALGKTVGELFSSGAVPSEVSGPVGIFVFANEARKLGFVYLLELAGVLSVNLAILNILPIPALDGGRLLFIAIEKIRGTRVNMRHEQLAHTVGFLLLIALMVAITYRDVVRIF